MFSSHATQYLAIFNLRYHFFAIDSCVEKQSKMYATLTHTSGVSS